MKSSFNRLPADTAKGFAGSQIDRGRRVSFQLDGRLVNGFAGDTVLSALLASGVDTLGTHLGEPVGLTHSGNPAIAPARAPEQALPMARTPAMDGAELITLGQGRSGLLERLFRPGRTLGLVLDQPGALARPWRTAQATQVIETDLVVIGGGVAGLSAALAAVRSGLRVTLVEAHPYLGGHSGLFGTQDGEDSPEESMARLAGAVQEQAAVDVLTATRAFALRPGLVRTHRVAVVDGLPQADLLDIAAAHIVLATGALERLPVFGGNRLPGISGTLEAWDMASRYGIWPGHKALIATGSNVAYRLATTASDIGITVERVLDSRPNPRSRFIEFTRAYGIVQSPGSAPVSVSGTRAGGQLHVSITGASEKAHDCERLILGGGWQPELTLWHVAGGASQWHPGHVRLEAVGAVDGMALAGAAAGYFTRQGCIQSGADAIDQLLGRRRKPVIDPIIDPLHETPDAAMAMDEAQEADTLPAYLDAGSSLLRRPDAPKVRWSPFGARTRPAALTALSEAPQALTIGEVVAGVQLGLIPPEAAGIVAQERVALMPLGPPGPAPSAPKTEEPDPVPAYLDGRFGSGARVARLTVAEQRRVETGALLYRSADGGAPHLAVGVILRTDAQGTMALVAADAQGDGTRVFVSDQGRMIAATLV